MVYKITVSVLVGLVLFVAAQAQPGSNPMNPKKTAPPKSKGMPAEKAAAEKKQSEEALDALIAAALANDAEVQVARSKVQLAEAELARARQQATHKVVSLNSAVREQKRAMQTAKEAFQLVQAANQRGTISSNDFLIAREKFEAVQAKQAALETELKLLTGPDKREKPAGMGIKLQFDNLEDVHRNVKWSDTCTACHQMPLGLKVLPPKAAGPVPDRIRKALDFPVKLGPKNAKVTFEQAIDLFKKSVQFDVIVRNDFNMAPVTSYGEELPIGAWLQLFMDTNPDLRLLVREYGLLVSKKELAPPDAISVADFWKQKPEKKP